MTTAWPRPSPATLADLDALPDDVIGEIIDGVLYTRNRPSFAHQHAATAIASAVFPRFTAGGDGPGGWWIVHDTQLAQPGSPHYVPDVVGWRRERMPAPPVAPVTLVPDWICEVLSPTTRHFDYLVKMPHYARIGVVHVWLVDVDERTVYAHRLDAGEWRVVGTYHDEIEARIEPFEGVALNVARWWAS
jgi:Uma2 family endonuclease